jgi:plastocyanin
MMRRALLTIVAVAAAGTALPVTPAIAGGGCLGKPTEATASTVELRKSCFTATVTHVDPGQQVAFVNRDGLTHNVIGFGTLWGDIQGIGAGETRRFTFTEDGIFPYACTLHPGMVGAVVVGDERHAGDAGESVIAAGPSTPSRGRGDAPDNRLPEIALALAALVLGTGIVLRRRRESPPGA